MFSQLLGASFLDAMLEAEAVHVSPTLGGFLQVRAARKAEGVPFWTMR